MAKRREVIWTPGAKTDLDEVVAFIAKDAPSAGLTFLEEVLTAADSLETLAERGRLVLERASPQMREIFIKHYRLLYEIPPDEGHILGFLHGACDFRPQESSHTIEAFYRTAIAL